MFCLDTNILIFAMNGRRPHISARLDVELAAGTGLLIPSVVLFEIEYGIARSDRRAQSAAIFAEFLSANFKVIGFDADDATEAGDIRAYLEGRGTPIGPYDILIAAQARRHRAALVTANRAEFDRVPGLVVTDWST